MLLEAKTDSQIIIDSSCTGVVIFDQNLQEERIRLNEMIEGLLVINRLRDETAIEKAQEIVAIPHLQKAHAISGSKYTGRSIPNGLSRKSAGSTNIGGF